MKALPTLEGVLGHLGDYAGHIYLVRFTVCFGSSFGLCDVQCPKREDC